MDQHDARTTRRAVLCAACVAPLLAACGGSDTDTPVTVGEIEPSGTPTVGQPSATARPTSGNSPSPSQAGQPTATATSGSRGGSDGSTAGGGSTGGGATTSPGSTSPTPKPSSTPTSDSPPPGALVRTSQVPVGGGVVLSGKGIVVTQPSAGSFRGFSVTCTHQGCPVDRVSGGNIICPCHGSQFSVADGSVTGGPARKPLGARAVKVTSGWVCTA